MPPQTPGKLQLSTVWKKIPKWLWGGLVSLSVIIALVQGYPWISLQEGALLNPSNLYSELFTITNQGYIPLTELSAACVVNYDDPHTHFSNSGARFGNFARYLGHGSTVTIPCFMTIGARSVPSGARLDVIVGYAFSHLNLDILRRDQSFHFQVITGTDGSQHWIFLSP